MDILENIKQLHQTTVDNVNSGDASQPSSRVTYDAIPKCDQTFAEVLSSSNIPLDAIRNVNIKEGQNCADISIALRKETIPTAQAIIAVKSKGECNFTFTCASSDDAKIVEHTLLTKYGHVLEVKKIASAKYQIKIVKIIADDISPKIISAKIIE